MKNQRKVTGRVTTAQRDSGYLFGEARKETLIKRILAKSAHPKDGSTNQDTHRTGTLEPPVDVQLLKNLRIGNPHHAACILAKVNATVGLGFKSDQVEKVVGAITTRGFRPILSQAGSDFEDAGNGYLEAVRRGGGKPTGLHYLAAESVKIFEEEDSRYFHYEVKQADGSTTKFPAYGDKDRFMAEVEPDKRSGGRDSDDVSEVIHFWMPSGMCDRYGAPDWLSCLPIMDLVQTQNQYWYDFFQNWGSIAKFLTVVSGQEIEDATWRKIESAFVSTVKGDGAFKTFATNLVGQDIQVKVHDLGGEPFATTAIEADRNMALDICAAHRTDPIIAQVIPSSKTTSTNKGVLRETVDLFQAQTVGIRQQIFKETLERTLGQDFKIKPIEKVKQEVSGVSQQMVTIEESGWTLKRLRDEMEFDMTPQLGGPVDATKEDTTQQDQQKDSGPVN